MWNKVILAVALCLAHESSSAPLAQVPLTDNTLDAQALDGKLAPGLVTPAPTTQPPYQFAFEVKDDQMTNYHNRVEMFRNGVLQGSYSLLSPDGVVRTSIYSDDGISGFQVTMHELQTNIGVRGSGLANDPVVLAQQRAAAAAAAAAAGAAGGASGSVGATDGSTGSSSKSVVELSSNNIEEKGSVPAVEADDILAEVTRIGNVPVLSLDQSFIEKMISETEGKTDMSPIEMIKEMGPAMLMKSIQEAMTKTDDTVVTSDDIQAESPASVTETEQAELVADDGVVGIPLAILDDSATAGQDEVLESEPEVVQDVDATLTASDDVITQQVDDLSPQDDGVPSTLARQDDLEQAIEAEELQVTADEGEVLTDEPDLVQIESTAQESDFLESPVDDIIILEPISPSQDTELLEGDSVAPEVEVLEVSVPAEIVLEAETVQDNEGSVNVAEEVETLVQESEVEARVQDLDVEAEAAVQDSELGESLVPEVEEVPSETLVQEAEQGESLDSVISVQEPEAELEAAVSEVEAGESVAQEPVVEALESEIPVEEAEIVDLETAAGGFGISLISAPSGTMILGENVLHLTSDGVAQEETVTSFATGASETHEQMVAPIISMLQASARRRS